MEETGRIKRKQRRKFEGKKKGKKGGKRKGGNEIQGRKRRMREN